MGVRLPPEYQEVEYIESPGSCYFDIPITYTSTDIISVDIVYQFLESTNNRWIAGENNLYGKQFEFGLYRGHWTSNGSVTIEILEGSGNTAKVHAYSAASEAARSINRNWRVFGRSGYSGIESSPGKIWSHRWTKNGEKMIDLVPCYRRSDGEVGMYDLASETFLTNQGQGDGFIAGPDVVEPIGDTSPWLMERRRLLMHNIPRYIYEASNLSFNGKSDCINTGVYLFTQENIDRDFEFIAEGIVGDGNTSDSTIICAKYDAGALGFLVRPTGNTKLNYKGTIYVKRNTNSTVIVRRINGVITLSGTNITNPTIQFTNAVFNHPLVFGCALRDDGTPYRYCPGTIAHVTVRWL